MSRVIKFRAWRDGFTWPTDKKVEPGCWLSDVHIDPTGRACYYDYELLYHDNLEKYGGKVHVEQFTGLLDKEGREIYEGDILEVSSDEPRTNALYAQGEYWMKDGSNPMRSVTRRSRIDWDIEQGMWQQVYLDWFQTCAGHKTGQPVSGFISPKESRVLGNIHQHPHLLS